MDLKLSKQLTEIKNRLEYLRDSNISQEEKSEDMEGVINDLDKLIKKGDGRLLLALSNFEDAWYELSEAWGEEYPEIEIDSYPFEGSFDKYEIKEWVNEFKEYVDSLDGVY